MCHKCVLVAQLGPTLCDPTDWGLPGSLVHRILQARILQWVAISFSNSVSLLFPNFYLIYLGSYDIIITVPSCLILTLLNLDFRSEF